jgi:hypothetical protein
MQHNFNFCHEQAGSARVGLARIQSGYTIQYFTISEVLPLFPGEYQESMLRNRGRFLQHPSNSSLTKSQLHGMGHYMHASALDEES